MNKNYTTRLRDDKYTDVVCNGCGYTMLMGDKIDFPHAPWCSVAEEEEKAREAKRKLKERNAGSGAAVRAA